MRISTTLKSGVKLLLIGLFLSYFQHNTIYAQEDFAIDLEVENLTGVPGVHSFTWGLDSLNRILIVGGRVDGLHQRQPFAAFLEQDNNKKAYVIDFENRTVYSTALSGLPTSMFEQIQSTNQQFYQRGNFLYTTGGYGYSNSASKHLTFPHLIAIDVNGLTNAIVNDQPVTNFFRQLTDSIFCVTGGQMGYLDSVFYLVGGQLFDGSYNPMGPDHGFGFTQIYTEQIRKFKLQDNGSLLSVTDYSEITDTDNLHRRDYNMTPQIFPNGEYGFTAFSGVFRKDVDLPFLNSVDITSSGHTVNNTFNQYLSQYHSAKFPLFDSTTNTMQTFFFGGMSQYKLDAQGNLIEDQDVPFVKTISKVMRYSDGSMEELKLGVEMPGLLGAGAEFIPVATENYWKDEILYINRVPPERTLVGYIIGGIASTASNIFFVNDGSQSSANTTIYGVYIDKSRAGTGKALVIKGDNVFNPEVFPNPVKRKLRIRFTNPNNQNILVKLLDMAGRDSMIILEGNNLPGSFDEKINVMDLPNGAYILRITNGAHSVDRQIIINH